MRALLHRMRKLWCAVTARCAIDPPHDPYLEWMADQEQASITARSRRQQTQRPTGNFMEQELLERRNPRWKNKRS